MYTVAVRVHSPRGAGEALTWKRRDPVFGVRGGVFPVVPSGRYQWRRRASATIWRQSVSLHFANIDYTVANLIVHSLTCQIIASQTFPESKNVTNTAR